MDLKLKLHHQMIQDGHPALRYPEERVGSWMNHIFPMPHSDPMKNDSLNSRKQKEEILAWHSRRLASRRPVRSMLQDRQASKRFARTLSAFFPAKRARSHKERFLRPRKWRIIPANSSHGGALPTAVSKMVSRTVRHYDQDERQPDAALRWDTIRPALPNRVL